ncbi:hypothetical protein [Desulfovulcanus sp.]
MVDREEAWEEARGREARAWAGVVQLQGLFVFVLNAELKPRINQECPVWIQGVRLVEHQ